MKKYWEKHVDEGKIAVVYNGLDYEKYLHADGSALRKDLALAADDLLIGMIGRVHPWKGQTYFLNIAKLEKRPSNGVFFCRSEWY